MQALRQALKTKKQETKKKKDDKQKRTIEKTARLPNHQEVVASAGAVSQAHSVVISGGASSDIDFQGMNLKNLKATAKSLGLTGYSAQNRATLVQRLTQAQLARQAPL